MRPEAVNNEIAKCQKNVDEWLINTGIIQIGSRHYHKLQVYIQDAVRAGFDMNSKPYVKLVRK